jgi:Ca2+-transporting ATPase
MNKSPTNSFQQSVPIILLSALIVCSLWILHHFLLTLLWSFIISFVLFPLYKQLNQYIRNETLSAVFLTLIITVILIGLTFSVLNLIENEIKTAYQLTLENFPKSPFELPKEIKSIPHFGHYLQNTINQFLENRHSLVNQFFDLLKQSSGSFAQIFGSIGQRTIKLCFVLVTVFFCFRDGELWLQQIKQGLHYFLGGSHALYLQTAGDTTRAVVYGLMLAALSQGCVAGMGYFVAGVKTPLLLAILTALLALIPMGATLVWFPTALMLIVTNQLWAGFGLLAWGFFAISTIDNIIRPLVICGASKVPFLVVMFGVFGGLSTFGTIGLFLGPVILSILLAVWKNFISLTPP